MQPVAVAWVVVTPLPRGLADPQRAVGVGTVAWFAAAIVLLVCGGPTAWIWACLTGGSLGLVGFAMIHWQRRAALVRGTRGAPHQSGGPLLRGPTARPPTPPTPDHDPHG